MSSPPPYTASEEANPQAQNEQTPDSTSTTLSNTESFPSIDDHPPPPGYGDTYGKIENDSDGFGAKASVTDDGRVDVRIQQRTKGLSTLLVPALRNHLNLPSTGGTHSLPEAPPAVVPKPGVRPPPPLNIVVQVVGSRGDVQPFVALGKVLKEEHNHRVRLATHPVFKDFVEENGLEFFSIDGDPAELMAFMVKNPGLMPGFDTLRSGDVGKRRQEIGKMIKGCWRSCIETGDGSGIEASDKNAGEVLEADTGHSMESKPRPFVADAIIANPPSFAHIHCAEKLGIPLHMMFTMPWSPTQAFPHPLANITSSNADASITNFMSYALVDMLTWQGLGDVINRFREKTLGLDSVNGPWAPGMLARMRIPFTYCWSPALIPKPRDWGSYISISGFYFLSLESGYTPAPELTAFLDSGPPPIYIGFGSIVVDDPNAMTKLIFDAVKKSGQRALVSKGWGGFGADQIGIPESVFMLGNVPHDWLFKRVSCVVHHGGAGTTAAGISCGKPTVVVPFFGDQPFWGAMVARAGAGPHPVPYKELTAGKLAELIIQALKPESLEKAKVLAEKISNETGTETGAQTFHQGLDVDKMRCLLSPTRASAWRLRRTDIRLSPFVVAVLANADLLKLSDLKLYRPKEHFVEDEPYEPITGGASALVATMGSMAMGVADMPVAALKALKIHPEAARARSDSNRSSTLSPSITESKLERSSSDASNRSETPTDNGPLTLTPTQSPTLARSSSPVSSTQGPEVAHAIVNQMAAEGTKSEAGTAQSQTDSRQTTAQEKGEAKNTYTLEDAIGTGKGVSRVVGAGIKSPMEFTVGLARGFRNAPKLYGDQTVRESEKVTGFSSGLRVASKEFGYGFYDGISGLVTQPLAGAKKEGVGGFLKGVGRGIGGVVFKPGAAIWGIPAYTSQGIYKELQKRFGPSVENWIIASRTAQGYEEFNASTEDERAAIIKRWKELKPYIRKKKAFGEENAERFQGMRERSVSAVSRTLSRSPQAAAPVPNYNDLQRVDTGMTDDSGVWSPITENNSATLSRASTMASIFADEKADDKEVEAAIHRSVIETSMGDAEEDAAIEKAIRASLADLDSRKANGASDVELQEAMQARIESAGKGYHESHDLPDSDSGHATETEDDDGELALALRESKKAYDEHIAEDDSAQREEDIVLQYMMKQSLAEEEMKQNKAAEAGV